MTRSLCLVDKAVAGCDWFPGLIDSIHPDRTMTLAAEPTMETVEALVADLRSFKPTELQLIGGGAVLDMGRLAVLAIRLGDHATIRLTRGRQGDVWIDPAMVAPSPVSRIIATPTTLGTGAEVSAAACVITGDHRRLVVAEALRATESLYHPACYSTLPITLIDDAILEVVMRVVGPWIVSDAGPADAAATAALALCRDLRPDVRAQDPQALEKFARLSGSTHGQVFAKGRRPYAAPLWYIANELSFTAGVTKMEAQRYLLRSCLQATERFGGPWGSAERLHQALTAAGWCAPTCTNSPVECFFTTLDTIEAPPLDFDADAVAKRCEMHWGLGLPALADVSREQLLAVLTGAVESTT